MGFRRYLNGIGWVLTVWSCQGFAQVSSGKLLSPVPGSNLTGSNSSLEQNSLIKKNQSYLANRSSGSGWSRELSLTQSQPLETEKKNPVTSFRLVPEYMFNEDYSAGLDLSFDQQWETAKKQTDSGDGKDGTGDQIENSPPSLKTTILNDVYIYASRSGYVRWTGILGLPTSDDAKDSAREWNLAISPSLVLENNWFRYMVSSDFIYDQNRHPSDEAIASHRFIELYANWTQMWFRIKTPGKMWSWYNWISSYNAWDKDNEHQETNEVATGPQIRFNPTFLLRLSASSKYSSTSPAPMFDSRSSRINLSAFLNF